MSGTTVKRCRGCGLEVDSQHTGTCPNGCNAGYDVAVGIIESVKIHDFVNVQITRAPRREQIKKNPYRFIFGVILFFVTIPLNLWEHDLAFLLQIIVGTYGVALMPINKKMIIEF